MRFFVAIFVILPILEMWLLIRVGGIIGALPTIALVFLTAMAGLALLRQQSFSTLFRARSRMAQGQLPANEMVEGIFLAVGGALLLTPGFITDLIGFSCLIPGVRQVLIAWGLKQFKVRQFEGSGFGSFHQQRFERTDFESSESPSHESQKRGEGTPGSQNSENQTIDGEFRRED